MYEQRQREALIKGRNTLERTSDSLANSERTAIETERIGTSVIEELGTQRESLVRASNRLDDIDITLTKSARVIRFLKYGVVLNKTVLILIIVLEVCIFGAITYVKHFRK